jgi:hypothetical protein
MKELQQVAAQTEIRRPAGFMQPGQRYGRVLLGDLELPQELRMDIYELCRRTERRRLGLVGVV